MRSHEALSETSARVFAALLALVTLTSCGATLPTQIEFEDTVAQIEFRETAPQDFMVTLTVADSEPRAFAAEGDEWRLDADITDRLFELTAFRARDRGSDDDAATDLDGRYVWLAPVDAREGNYDSMFLPMADGATYDIRLGAYGLILRPTNEVAARTAADAVSPSEAPE